MKTPKTLTLIECRFCGGSYYAGETKLVLAPATELESADELYIIVRKIPKCQSCKQRADRTRGGQKHKFEY